MDNLLIPVVSALSVVSVGALISTGREPAWPKRAPFSSGAYMSALYCPGGIAASKWISCSNSPYLLV